jgi:hypothetical protein
VLFVDHDPARLAGREDERWVFGDGRVTILGGPAPAAAVPEPRPERVTIRLEAADAARVVEQVRAIAGVRVLSADIETGAVQAGPSSAGPQEPGAPEAGFTETGDR